MKKLFPLLLALVLLTACGPSDADIAAAIAEMEAAKPTETLVPPTETLVPAATFTPEPTETPIRMLPTATSTPEPTEKADDEEIILQEAMLLFYKWHRGYNNFSDSIDQIVSDAEILLDEEWVANTNTDFDDWVETSSDMLVLATTDSSVDQELKATLSDLAIDTIEFIAIYQEYLDNPYMDDPLAGAEEALNNIGNSLVNIGRLTGW